MKKIIYGCYPSLYSLIIVNLLVRKYNVPIKYLVLSSRTLKIDGIEIAGIKGVLYALKRFDVNFLLYQGVLPFLLLNIIRIKALFHKQEKIYSFKKISKAFNINLIKSSNFNSDKLINSINDADLFVSMCLDQILNEYFFSTFQGVCINIHPSDLPDFRGVDSIFQFLLSSEELMGVSLHKMTSKIDEGFVFEKRFIPRVNSHLGLMKEFVIVGCDMISSFINDTNRDVLKEKERKVRYPYKSWATKEELTYFDKNCNYWRWRDIWNWKLNYETFNLK